MSRVFIVHLFGEVQGSLSPSTPQGMLPMCILQIISHGVETDA